MILKLAFLFMSLSPTGFAAQSGIEDGSANVNYEKVDCHCPSCVKSHPSWAVACGSSAKVGRETPTNEPAPGTTNKSNRANN